MLKNNELIGKTFGRLQIIKLIGKSKNYQFIFGCLCDCGNYKEIVRESLTSGRSTSCGCYNIELRRLTKGIPLSKEHKTKAIEALKPYWGKEDKCPKWVGDNVGYQGLHQWLRNKYGKATHCENDPTHKAKSYQWANISGEYKRDRNDFKMLCPPCHKKMDFGNYCGKGHPLFGDNCRIEKDGRRTCKTCKNIWQKNKYWARIDEARK